MTPLPTSPPTRSPPHSSRLPLSPFDDPRECFPHHPIAQAVPTYCIPPDQQFPISVQQKIAETIIADVRSRCDPPRPFVTPLVHVAAIGWWTATNIAGFTGYADHPEHQAPTLGVTMVAVGRDATNGMHPAHLGIDPHTWAEVLIHEAAHLIELTRAGTPANGRALLTQFPHEATRPSFLRACDDVARAVFGCPLTPGIDISHWPRGQHGAASFIPHVADAVSPYLAPPARWTRDAAGVWQLDMTLNGVPVIRDADSPRTLMSISMNRRTA
jgi:hypothetical protein